MDPNDIKLETISKMFEYEKLAREVDECRNIDELKNITKSYIRLYFKQQEVLKSLPAI
tara:strand:- start:131 stop:304 length:174 start_codon:yes stop_codon:yes gene_type:complete